MNISPYIVHNHIMLLTINNILFSNIIINKYSNHIIYCTVIIQIKYILEGDVMKKILLSISIILPLIFMSCTNKVVDNNKPKEETNITENNKPQENNEVKEGDTIKEEEPKENVEKEPATPEDVEVISPIETFVDSRFGYLDSIYLDSGDYYLSIDEAEIFFDEEAIEEAVYDGNAGYHDDGRAFLPNPYYIRNNYNNLSNFKIAKDAKFYLCGFALKDERNDNSINLYEVSLEEFKEYTTKFKSAFEDKKNPDNVIEDFVRWPVWADVQDGIAVKLYQQYTP
jgi:hypothetical protein